MMETTGHIGEREHTTDASDIPSGVSLDGPARLERALSLARQVEVLVRLDPASVGPITEGPARIAHGIALALIDQLEEFFHGAPAFVARSRPASPVHYASDHGWSLAAK